MGWHSRYPSAKFWRWIAQRYRYHPPATALALQKLQDMASVPADTKTLRPMLVRLPPDLHQEAKQRAADEDLSVAQVIRRALREYLAQPSR